MKRIIWHWTGGTYTPNSSDLRSYHILIDGDGKVHPGDLGPEANLDCSDGIYARHTRGCNTGAIGIGICGMRGAKENPFDAGQFPMKPCQIDTLVTVIADLCNTYKIPVSRSTTLNHAEVQPTLGVKQRGKWDTAWLPNHTKETDDPIRIGDILRSRVASAMDYVLPAREHTPVREPVVVRKPTPVREPVVIREPVVVPEVIALINEADDRGSISIAATVTQFSAAVSAVPLAIFADLDTTVILAVLAAVTILASIYLFTSRRNKGRAARAARAVL